MAEPLSRALKQCAYTTPTPVQVQALPVQLANRDLMALAETGSGKTAAFVLPILNAMAQNPADPAPREVMTLILAPTRELAIQIDGEVASLSRNMHIRRAVVLGGVSKGPQIHALKRGVHVLVATPGRLLDHVNARHADLRSVRVLVLDEADRMFDMGFVRDIRKIAALLPRQRRTAMFSATMPPEIKKLANELLTEPAFIDLSPKQLVVDRIDQKVMMVRTADKQSRLHTILGDEACTRAIIFTRTKRGADRVADRLGMAGIGATAIHGNKAQNARQRALADFSAGHVKVLVATDIAARGIDVSNVSHVINFEMPVEAETYVHRIGRTARKGESGIAISLCDPSERAEIVAIERLMKQKIEVIGDVGGEALPMPERRPHRDHDAPRREGAHRKGPRPPHRGQGARGEGRSTNDRGEGRNINERGDRPARRDDRKPHDANRPRHSEGERAAFDPLAAAARPERAQHERPQHDRGSHDRPRHTRPGGERTERTNGDRPGGDRANGERPKHARPHHERSDRPSSGPHRREDARRDDNRGERPASAAAHGKPHGKTHSKPSNGHADQGHPNHGKSPKPAGKPAHGGPAAPRGERNWNGQQPPKFLKQRAR